VSCEAAETPVTAVAELYVKGKTAVIASQWNSHIRMWSISYQGFLTPCGSVDGQVYF